MRWHFPEISLLGPGFGPTSGWEMGFGQNLGWEMGFIPPPPPPPSGPFPPFGLIVHKLSDMLFPSVDSVERLVYSCFLASRFSKDQQDVQLAWKNLDFIFSGNNLFLSVHLFMSNTGLHGQ